MLSRAGAVGFEGPAVCVGKRLRGHVRFVQRLVLVLPFCCLAVSSMPTVTPTLNDVIVVIGFVVIVKIYGC